MQIGTLADEQFTKAQPAASSSAMFEQFQRHQQFTDQMRFMTCGSVDDGKSTLIGRIIWETQQLSDDQLVNLENDSRRCGTQGDNMDFALLVDGLSAEREQGITIDIAYRYFSTMKRKFVAMDTPGHEQYTRNMVTAASSADVAILLVDARKGILTQTRRHAYLASLLGVRHLALAVNKMDMVDFDREIFREINEGIQQFCNELGFSSLTAMPISALHGDNITERSHHTDWYSGPTLMGYLETFEISVPALTRLVMPVQWINRASAEFRGITGTLAEGRVCIGDELRVTASGEIAKVSDIVTMDGSLQAGEQGRAVTLLLDRDVDVSRGDVLSHANTPLQMTDHFEATLIWMGDEPGLIGRTYDIKLATQGASASVTNIKYKINVNSRAHEPSRAMTLNDVVVCNISLSRALTFDTYTASKILGGFILIDRLSNATVAAGMISHDLRRSQNIYRQALSVTRKERERLNGHAGRVIWFTGLSGAGKSTIANALELELHRQGRRTYVLDGDNIRHGLNKDLGFTDADRVENIRRIAEVARLMMDAGMIVMTAFISPFARERAMARELIGEKNFFEVFVNAPLSVCEQRDPKGLYGKSRRGLIPNMTGIGSPYDVPENPDITVDSSSLSIEAIVESLMSTLSRDT